MEIHAPEKPILTVKEALVHLSIVTAGILIALSLEGLVEYVHHRTVVREARQILKDEIEENLKDLNVTMDRIALQRDGLVKGVKIFSAMAKGEKPQMEGLRWMLNYRTADLHVAGHSTAELTGAFAYMDYREVSRYAAIYDSQDRFLRAQSSALTEGLSAFAWRQERDLAGAAPADFVVFVDRLRQTLAAMTLTQQFGSSLEKDYAEFLATVRIRKPSAIDGDWTGALGGGRLPLVFHIATYQEGMTASLDSPKQNGFGIPSSSVSLEGSQFKYEMNVNPARFVATVDDAKSTITGTWTQGDYDQPLVLTRQKGGSK